MTEPGSWQVAAFALIGLAFYVFMALDGFDMGIGMTLPFLEDEGQKRRVLDIAWPFWDGNELWAVIGGALILAAFPVAFALLLGSLAPHVAVLLVFVVYRSIAFEAWFKDEGRRRLWERAFAVGSFLLAFAFGALVGNLVYGLPLDASGAYAGGPLTPFRPYPLLAGALVAAAALFHGAAYLRRRTEGSLRARADRIARIAWAAYAALGAAAFLATAFFVPEAAGKAAFWAGSAIAAASLGWARYALEKGRPAAPFLGSLAALAGLWIAAVGVLFPYVVAPWRGAGGLTVASAASPGSTLSFLVPVSLAGFAIVASYTIYIYRALKGKESAR
jgi:cytochrome d ubiquinol oxidase subunit II